MGAAALLLAVGTSAEPRAYVSNSDSDTLSAVDTARNLLIGTVVLPPGSHPHGVAIGPNGRLIYVASLGPIGSGLGGRVLVINAQQLLDPTTDAITASIQVDDAPEHIVVAHDGRHAYVTNSISDTVSVIDTQTNAVTATVRVGTGPLGIALTPDDAFAFVTIPGAGDIEIIDSGSNKVVSSIIPTGGEPQDVAISADGLLGYAANGDAATLSIIRVKRRTVLSTIPLGGNSARGVALLPDGSVALVTNYDGPLNAGGNVAVVGTKKRIVTATIPVGTQPEGIVVSADGKFAYVANGGSNTVSVIDTGTNRVTATIAVGLNPYGIALSPPCTGDCNDDGRVTVDEILLLVESALGGDTVSPCQPQQFNNLGVRVRDILGAVNNSLTVCGGGQAS